MYLLKKWLFERPEQDNLSEVFLVGVVGIVVTAMLIFTARLLVWLNVGL